MLFQAGFCAQMNVRCDGVGKLDFDLVVVYNQLPGFLIAINTTKREFFDGKKKWFVTVFHFYESGIPGFLSVTDNGGFS